MTDIQGALVLFRSPAPTPRSRRAASGPRATTSCLRALIGCDARRPGGKPARLPELRLPLPTGGADAGERPPAARPPQRTDGGARAARHRDTPGHALADPLRLLLARDGLAPEDFPNSVIADRLSLTLLLFAQLTDAQQDRVVQELVSGLRPRRHMRRTARPKGRVLYVGHSYYHAWYLSRELRKLGGKQTRSTGTKTRLRALLPRPGHAARPTADATNRATPRSCALASRNDIFHFSNAHGIAFGFTPQRFAERLFGQGAEIRLFRRLGKKIVYSNNACLDGVLSRPSTPGARADLRDLPLAFEAERVQRPAQPRLGRTPQQPRRLPGNAAAIGPISTTTQASTRCPSSIASTRFWRPDLPCRRNTGCHREPTVMLYHAVGNASNASKPGQRQPQVDVYLVPARGELRAEGRDVDLFYVTDIPNQTCATTRLQSDIVCDMLTVGWFGANVREALTSASRRSASSAPPGSRTFASECPGYVEELGEHVVCGLGGCSYDRQLFDVAGDSSRTLSSQAGRRKRPPVYRASSPHGHSLRTSRT